MPMMWKLMELLNKNGYTVGLRTLTDGYLITLFDQVHQRESSFGFCDATLPEVRDQIAREHFTSEQYEIFLEESEYAAA
jgi:hypothetical protein